MSAQAENKSSSFDRLKWLIVIAIIAATIWANQEYADFPSAYRILAMLGAGLIAVLFAFSTAKGREFKQYAHESRIEARKVVWPNRRETVQTTFIVIAFTVVVALILWGIDAILVSLIDMVMGV
jgi:preprotein translocase subunit SecE